MITAPGHLDLTAEATGRNTDTDARTPLLSTTHARGFESYNVNTHTQKDEIKKSMITGRNNIMSLNKRSQYGNSDRM